MPTVPISTADHALLIDNAGEYVVADQTAPNQPLVTPNASLTSKARHVVARSTGATVFARFQRGLLGGAMVSPVSIGRKTVSA